jgi:acyl-coenzyme A thioesterase PaaI-like protein
VKSGESAETWAFRKGFNLWPCYWGTGARVTYIARDWREMRVELPLNLRTRNYVGTIFGGSLYGAVDPIYMLMLMKILGREYIVWDKAASIRFRRPGKSLLEARFVLSEEEIAAIRELTAREKSVDRVYTVEFKDREGNVCATIEKTVYIKRKGQQSSPGGSR